MSEEAYTVPPSPMDILREPAVQYIKHCLRYEMGKLENDIGLDGVRRMIRSDWLHFFSGCVRSINWSIRHQIEFKDVQFSGDHIVVYVIIAYEKIDRPEVQEIVLLRP